MFTAISIKSRANNYIIFHFRKEASNVAYMFLRESVVEKPVNRLKISKWRPFSRWSPYTIRKYCILLKIARTCPISIFLVLNTPPGKFFDKYMLAI